MLGFLEFTKIVPAVGQALAALPSIFKTTYFYQIFYKFDMSMTSLSSSAKSRDVPVFLKT